MYRSVFSEYMYVSCVCAFPMEAREGPLYLELQTVVNSHVDAVNQIHFYCASIPRLQLPSQISQPRLVCL